MTTISGQSQQAPAAGTAAPPTPYEEWIATVGIPIHRGYYVEDLRTLDLGPWPERECDAAFLVLAGQEGVTEARVTEIAPTKTLPPQRFALDEVVYVVEGRGLTTVWAEGSGPKHTFEWEKQSMFIIPRNYSYQLTNTHGSERVRLLHYNYLPLSMAIVPDANFFFNNPYVDLDIFRGEGEDPYSEAKSMPAQNPRGIRGGPCDLARQVLPGHGRVGQAAHLPGARRGRAPRRRPVCQVHHVEPYVRLSLSDVQEGAPPRPRRRHRHSGRGGVLRHVAGGRRARRRPLA